MDRFNYLSQFNQDIPHRYAQQLICHITRDPFKLTANTDHHTWVLSLESTAFENNRVERCLEEGSADTVGGLVSLGL